MTTASPSPVPRIDVSPIVGAHAGPAPDPSEVRKVQDALRGACAEIGFMTIVGHGVPPATIAAGVAAAERFFALPRLAKHALAPRHWNAASPNVYRGYFPASAAGKEGLDLGDPTLDDPALLARPYHERNRLPAELVPGWAQDVAAWFDALSALARSVLGALVAALGGQPERVARAFARPASLSTLRFNFYPERDEPVALAPDDGAALSCEAHVDSGLLTLLHQDGGLQVRGKDGAWHDVEADADAFVVNTGLALQRMTDRDLVATRHRVLHERRPRLSIPFFFEPVPDFPMDPRSLGLPYASPAEPPVYEDFLRASLAKFAEYQR